MDHVEKLYRQTKYLKSFKHTLCAKYMPSTDYKERDFKRQRDI